MTVEELAIETGHRIIGPHSRYSKIGRIRREKLREEIKISLLRFYDQGRQDASNDLRKMIVERNEHGREQMRQE